MDYKRKKQEKQTLKALQKIKKNIFIFIFFKKIKKTFLH
jgi:hypothetical protein